MCVDAAKELEKGGTKVRVVSMMCWELFEAQGQGYIDQILPTDVEKRVSIEAGCTFGWSRYVGPKVHLATVRKKDLGRGCSNLGLRQTSDTLLLLLLLRRKAAGPLCIVDDARCKQPADSHVLLEPAWIADAGHRDRRGPVRRLGTRPGAVQRVWHHHRERGGQGKAAFGRIG